MFTELCTYNSCHYLGQITQYNCDIFLVCKLKGTKARKVRIIFSNTSLTGILQNKFVFLRILCKVNVVFKPLQNVCY